MFGDHAKADYIAFMISAIDVKCREELRNRLIVEESDYVSTLCTRIRDWANINSINCVAKTLEDSLERKFGTDSIIIFRIKDEVKIGMFEAKYPRTTQRNYPWDYLDAGLSHFSDQIERQLKIDTRIAVWEMFFNEADNGYQSPPYEVYGSSCAWHKDSYAFVKGNGLLTRIWKTDDLKNLLMAHSRSIYDIIYDIISCKAGKKIKINTTTNSIPISSKTKETIDIPLPPSENLVSDKLDSFLKKNGVQNYIYMDLTSFQI